MDHHAATIAKTLRDKAAIESSPLLKTIYEGRAAYYEALASETLDEYFARTERESFDYVRRATARSRFRAQTNIEIYLMEWFGDKRPGYVLAADLPELLQDAIGQYASPNQYGEIMQQLGFVSKVERKGKSMKRLWRRGRNGGRYVPTRDAATGRMVPRQVDPAPPVPPPLPY